MAIYRQVQTSFWEDTKVLDDMDFIDRYFYLYLLTNPHVNQSGCYEISIRNIINESGFDRDRIQSLLERFENDFKIIKYSKITKEILIINFYKYNWTSSPKVQKCIKKEISKIKSNELIGYIRGIYKKVYPMEMVSQEKEKEKEKEKNNKKREEKKESFSKGDYVAPTLADIFDYSLSKGIDDMDYCERFYEHYEAIGWVNGSGQKIKNWKLIFNNWIKGDKKDAVEESFVDEAGFIHKDGRRRF